MFWNLNLLEQVLKTREACIDFCLKKNLIKRFRRCNAGKHEVEWTRNASTETGKKYFRTDFF